LIISKYKLESDKHKLAHENNLLKMTIHNYAELVQTGMLDNYTSFTNHDARLIHKLNEPLTTRNTRNTNIDTDIEISDNSVITRSFPFDNDFANNDN